MHRRFGDDGWQRRIPPSLMRSTQLPASDENHWLCHAWGDRVFRKITDQAAGPRPLTPLQVGNYESTRDLGFFFAPACFSVLVRTKDASHMCLGLSEPPSELERLID